MSDDIERDRTRGIRAKELLENELVQEALTTLRDEYVKAWETSPARDSEGRERLWVMVKLVEKFRGHLEQVWDAGKLADDKLVEIERRKKFGIF